MIVGVLILASAIAGQTEDANQKARSLYESAVQAYDGGRHDVAIELFEAAYRLAPRPIVAYSMAQAYRLQFMADNDPFKLKRALQLYRAFLEQTPSGARRSHALEHIAYLEPIWKRVEADLPPGSDPKPPPEPAVTSQKVKLYVLTGSTAGAQVSVAGGEPSEPPLVLDLDPGRYPVRVSAPKYKTRTVEAVLLEGQPPQTLQIELEHLPSTLTIVAPEGAEILLDSRYEGLAPLDRTIELPAGRHFVAVTQRGRYPYGREVVLDHGENVELTAELEETAQRTISYYLMSGGVVMLAGAGVIALTALGPQDEALAIEANLGGAMPRALTEPEAVQHMNLTAERDDRVTAAWIVGAAAFLVGGTGALLYFLDVPRAPSPTLITRSPGVAIAPVVSPDSGGVVVAGSF